MQWRRWFRSRGWEQKLDAELRFHIEQQIHNYIQRGDSPNEARRKALLDFGGLDQVKEECRDSLAYRFLDVAWQDFRIAFRMLAKRPTFTFAAISALALGIGTNTAIFAVVNTVLLEPVHAPEPDRVVVFMATNKQGSSSRASQIKFNLWREQTSVFEDVSAYVSSSVNLTGVEQPEPVSAMIVTKNYFRLFGLAIARGRGFTDGDQQPTGSQLFQSGHVVILSDPFWKRAFGGDPNILGRIISLSSDPYEVIGVLAGGIQTETSELPDVWTPFPIAANSTSQVHYFEAAGRLKPGITLEQANAHLQLTTEEFRRKFPTSLSTSRGDIFTVEPMKDVLVTEVHSTLLILLGAVSLVLFIACANVANLLLVQAVGRKREVAIRLAIGASRARIIWQLLTESVLLATMGGVLGLGMGMVGIRTLLAINTAGIPRIGPDGSNVTIDWRVLTFTLLVALITGILFGLIPALQASSTNLTSSLKGGRGRIGPGFRRKKARSLLVISEMSLALLLLVGSGLLIRTLMSLRSVNPGFDPHNVEATLATLDTRMTETSGFDQIIHRVLSRLTALPGVNSAAITGLLPLQGDFNSLPITVVGRPLDGPSHGNSRWMVISPRYFDVLKIPLLRGRFFDDADRRDGQGVAIINRAMWHKFWPDDDPLGAQLYIGKDLGPNFEEPPRRVVGIVGDVHDDALNRDPLPAVFIPVEQRPGPGDGSRTMWVVVRTYAPSQSVNSAVQTALRDATGGLVPPLRSMEEVMVHSTARQDFNMLLMTIFGGAALLLAVIGIYGLMAYSVQQRTQEIGIRLALGAAPNIVRNMVISEGMRFALTGVAIGIAAAFGLTRFLASFLFGVTTRDPLVFATVPLFLSAIALIAVWVPAHRASRINPADALRFE